MRSDYRDANELAYKTEEYAKRNLKATIVDPFKLDEQPELMMPSGEHDSQRQPQQAITQLTTMDAKSRNDEEPSREKSGTMFR